MADELTAEQINKNLALINFTIASDYICPKAVVKFKHACGNEIRSSYNNMIKRLKTPLKCCEQCHGFQPRATLIKQITNVCNEKKIKCLNIKDFKSLKTELKWACSLCETEWECDSRYILDEKNECPECAGVSDEKEEPSTESHAEDEKKASRLKLAVTAANYVVLWENPKAINKQPAILKCPTGHHFISSIDNFILGKRRCPYCASNKKRYTVEYLNHNLIINKINIKIIEYVVKTNRRDCKITYKCLICNCETNLSINEFDEIYNSTKRFCYSCIQPRIVTNDQLKQTLAEVLASA